MGTVFVLNSHARHGLEAIRCLGLEGLQVTAGSSKRLNAGRLSRFADRSVTYPEPETEPEAFIQAIERELGTRAYDMLLPVNGPTVELVVEHTSRLTEWTNIPFPSHEKLRIGTNKRRTIEAARDIDIPHPKTLFSGESSLETVDRELDYPLVIKPVRGSGRLGVSICDSFAELVRFARQAIEAHGPVLFQEFIPNGGERGVYTLYDSSHSPVGRTVQRRIRSHPPEGGASTYRETVEDSELVALADELLTALDWQGLAMIEFRIDDRTGEPKLMEINPRLWGSLALSRYAGVNFPYLLYQLIIGEDPEQCLDYDVGVRSRYLFTDGLQILERERRLGALCEFFFPFFASCRYDLLSRRDPLPVLGQLGYYGTSFLADFRPVHLSGRRSHSRRTD